MLSKRVEQPYAEALKQNVRTLEEKLVSIGPRFSFLKTKDSLVGREKLDPNAKRELKNAKKSLTKVEKDVRAEDSKWS